MKRGDDGVTLLELLVCLAISSIIIAALAASFLASTKSIDQSSHQMDDTHDAQMASRFFTTDVQSANLITKAGTSICTGGSSLVTFTWFGWTGSNHTVFKFASYVFVQSQDGEQQLLRSFCSSDGAASTVVIAHNLAGPPTVTCRMPDGTLNSGCDDPGLATAELSGTAQSGATDILPYDLRATRRVS